MFSQYGYKWDLFFSTCPVGYIRLQLQRLLFALQFSPSVTACTCNLWRQPFSLSSIKMFLRLQRDNTFFLWWREIWDLDWPLGSPDSVWREPVLEIVDEVKVERAELGGSHGTPSEESKESFQMDEERIQRVGRRKRSEWVTDPGKERSNQWVWGGWGQGSWIILGELASFEKLEKVQIWPYYHEIRGQRVLRQQT